jgi:hypothetical protein
MLGLDSILKSYIDVIPIALLLGDTLDFGIAVVFDAFDAQHPIFYLLFILLWIIIFRFN